MDAGCLLAHLRAILGEEGYVLFTQALGGTRIYVPYRIKDDSEIVAAIGRERADKLARALAPATIRVPLARRERALHYYMAGLSNAKIARRLGITERGVEKLLRREPDLPPKPGSAKQPAQLTLF